MEKSTKITGTRYVLAVKNLEVSAHYYEQKLGLITLWKTDDWQLLYRDTFIVMLGECPDDRSAFETVNHSYFAYVDVKNIDELYTELQATEAGIKGLIVDEPWGQREFSIQTIDGHRIRFGQAIDDL